MDLQVDLTLLQTNMQPVKANVLFKRRLHGDPFYLGGPFAPICLFIPIYIRYNLHMTAGGWYIVTMYLEAHGP